MVYTFTKSCLIVVDIWISFFSPTPLLCFFFHFETPKVWESEIVLVAPPVTCLLAQGGWNKWINRSQFSILCYSRKKPNMAGRRWPGGEESEDIIYWKPSWNCSFFYFTSGNSRQKKAQPLDIPQNCVRSLGNSKVKNKNPWKFHIIFASPLLEIPLRF